MDNVKKREPKVPIVLVMRAYNGNDLDRPHRRSTASVRRVAYVLLVLPATQVFLGVQRDLSLDKT